MKNSEICLLKTVESENSIMFNTFSHDIFKKGYSIHPNGLPSDLADMLWNHARDIPAEDYKKSGVDRDNEHTLDSEARTDKVCWIDTETQVGKSWIHWTDSLKNHLNKSLFLGMNKFESHFSFYGKGDFYKKHRDAFSVEDNRIFTLIVYLNPEWQDGHGGELIIYSREINSPAIKVKSMFGTVVLFLSEEFSHEVLPAHQDRLSIAGCFCVNRSSTPNDQEAIQQPEYRYQHGGYPHNPKNGSWPYLARQLEAV